MLRVPVSFGARSIFLAIQVSFEGNACGESLLSPMALLLQGLRSRNQVAVAASMRLLSRVSYCFMRVSKNLRSVACSSGLAAPMRER